MQREEILQKSFLSFVEKHSYYSHIADYKNESKGIEGPTAARCFGKFCFMAGRLSTLIIPVKAEVEVLK